MTINKVLDLLYELIPLDSHLRKVKLRQLLKQDKEGLPILFSVDYLCTYSSGALKSYPNEVSNTEETIYKILLHILNSKNVKEVNTHLALLNDKHQVVIKLLLQDNNVYTQNIILEYIHELYTPVVLKEKLMSLAPSTPTMIPYVISDKSLDYTYRGSMKTNSSIVDKNKRPNVPLNYCYLTDRGKIVVKGDKSLYLYVVDGTPSPTIFSSLKQTTEQELTVLKYLHKGKYLTTFGSTMEVTYLPKEELRVYPYDWFINKDYNVVGVIFKVDNNIYKVKYPIPHKLLALGVNRMFVDIRYKKYQGKCTKIIIEDIGIIGEI